MPSRPPRKQEEDETVSIPIRKVKTFKSMYQKHIEGSKFKSFIRATQRARDRCPQNQTKGKANKFWKEHNRIS